MLKLRGKDGQIRMSETIAVLFIFFVLILFGIIFYYKYQQIAFAEKADELLGVRAMETTSKTLFMPELICSKGEAEPEDNCFDMLKLRSVNGTFKKYLDNYYFDIFSYAKVEVFEVYPEKRSWLLYDKPKPEYEKLEPTYFVITLRDEVAGEGESAYSYGYVKVSVYA